MYCRILSTEVLWIAVFSCLANKNTRAYLVVDFFSCFLLHAQKSKCHTCERLLSHSVLLSTKKQRGRRNSDIRVTFQKARVR